MKNNLIRTSIIACIAWCMAGCHALIEHRDETELTISVDSTGNKVIQETTRKNTHVDVECKGDVNLDVFMNGRFKR